MKIKTFGKKPVPREFRTKAVSIALVVTAFALLHSSLSRWNGMKDANWDLLNYHAYLPSALLGGTWSNHFHPAGIHSFLTPYLDLFVWPMTTMMSGAWGTAVIGSVQLLAVFPLFLSAWLLQDRKHFSEALAVSLVALTGAMFVTEFGGTMGDSIAAVPALLGFSLLLALFCKNLEATKWSSWATSGALFGLAIALKWTMAYISIGVVAVCVLLLVWRQVKAALILIFSMVVSTSVFYAPWGIVLFQRFDSPFFPMWNQIFQAPRFPVSNFDDTRFGAQSIGSLVRILNAPMSNPNLTSELRFYDVRWSLAWIACLSVALIFGIEKFKKRDEDNRRVKKPLVVAIVFWASSTFTWAVLFGIQRYAIFLELLALPIFWSLVRVLLGTSRQKVVIMAFVTALLVVVASTTKPVDFGRRKVGQDSIIPSAQLDQLSKYDAVVLAQAPLAHLYALVRNSESTNAQIWFSMPFNEFDAEIGRRKIMGRYPVVITYEGQEKAAVNAAVAFGFEIAGCQPLLAPLKNSLVREDILLCDTIVPEVVKQS